MSATPQIWWNRDFFKSGPGLDAPCPERIDITGRMRVLVFGPMLILPAGRWRLTAHFGLSEEAASHPYILQFIHGTSVAEQRVQPRRAGRYELALENTFEADAVAALRLWLGGPAFHGDLKFFGAAVEDLAPT